MEKLTKKHFVFWLSTFLPMVKKQSKEGRSRSSLSDVETDSNMNKSISKSSLNLRAYSSSPMNPSPVASSRFGSTSGLDLGFLSSSSNDLSESDCSAADDDVFFPSRTSRPTTIRREVVRDRSLGRTSEKLYRKVSNISSLRRSAFPLRSVNRFDNRRSRSVHASKVRSQKEDHRQAIGKKDQHISIEYMHITSFPSSSFEQELPRENNNIPLGSPVMSSKNHLKSNVLRNSCQSEVLNVSNPVQSTASSSAKPVSNEAFYFGGPEYMAWWKSVYGDTRSVLLPKQPVEIRGVFKSQLSHFRSRKTIQRVEQKEDSVSEDLSLWDRSDNERQGQLQAKPDSQAVYLRGPEYKAWCSARSLGRSSVLSAPRNKIKVTGMFKTVLNRYRPSETAEKMPMPAKTVLPKDAEWGSGTLFMAASHSVANTNPSAFLPSHLSTRLSLIPRPTRSCFATPCRPRIELARKSGSSIEAKRNPSLKSKVQLTPFPRDVSLMSDASMTDSPFSTNSTDESGKASNVTNNQAGPIRNFTKNVELQVLVDGQPKSVSFPFDFKSIKERPVVQVLEVILDKQSIWRRKQSSHVSKDKKSSSANKE
uniref:Uncharacterized protein n=1 Tax=Ditylenchus dipsaci TaxID=166011 RepID=A0A915EWU7_9BILA